MSVKRRPDGILIGRVVGVFGLRGDVKVAASLFEVQPGMMMQAIDESGARRALRVASVQPGRGHLRVHFDGVADVDQAEGLRGLELRVAADQLTPLPPNAYRESELVGMIVFDSKLGEIGAVVGIAHYPGSDMLIVGPKRVLLPMLEAYHMRVDRAARQITTTLPDGFTELL